MPFISSYPWGQPPIPSDPYYSVAANQSSSMKGFPTYNGHTCCQAIDLSNIELELFTEASGSCRFGAVFGMERCASVWPETREAMGLGRKEPNTFCVFPDHSGGRAVWPLYAGLQDLFLDDNLSIVHCISGLMSSCTQVFSLLRHLVLQCLGSNIWFRALHVSGHANILADSLSCFYWQDIVDLV